MPVLFQGRIVWIDVPDRNGVNKYRRPVIVLNPTEEIDSEDELQGVVVSHTAWHRDPRPDEFIELPHQPRGLVSTKLRKASVACCDWLVSFRKSEVAADQIGGHVQPALLEAIVDKVVQLHRPKNTES